MPQKERNEEISIKDKHFKLAHRLFLYEKLKKLNNCPSLIIQNQIELIAQAIDDIPEEINCDLLISMIEDMIISDILGNTTQSSCFNCEHYIQIILKFRGKKNCPYMNKFWNYIHSNAHKICPQYILDENEFNKVLSDVDNRINIIKKKYDINADKVKKIINYHVKKFLTELKEIPSHIAHIDSMQNSGIWQ